MLNFNWSHAATDIGQRVIAEEFRHLARNRAGEYAPLYAKLAEAIADDPLLLAIAAEARPGQSRPDLLLASVHYLLHGNPDQPAAQFYPSLTDKPDRDRDPVPVVLAFCHKNSDQLRHLVGNRLVQTNEVQRCTFLMPALQVAAALSGRPLAVIEIGASVGLNLLFDHYRYYYTDSRNQTWQVGDSSAALTLECVLRGPYRLASDQVPKPIWRLGIDLNPLDSRMPDDRRWLRSLIWADHISRLNRLDAALRVAATHLVTVLAGDAVIELPGTVDRAPEDAALVVYHSAVLAHMTRPDRDRFTDVVLACSHRRTIFWIQAEPRLDRDIQRLRLTVCDNGVVEAEYPLGRYHPHGEWLEMTGLSEM